MRASSWSIADFKGNCGIITESACQTVMVRCICDLEKSISSSPLSNWSFTLSSFESYQVLYKKEDNNG